MKNDHKYNLFNGYHNFQELIPIQDLSKIVEEKEKSNQSNPVSLFETLCTKKNKSDFPEQQHQKQQKSLSCFCKQLINELKNMDNNNNNNINDLEMFKFCEKLIQKNNNNNNNNNKNNINDFYNTRNDTTILSTLKNTLNKYDGNLIQEYKTTVAAVLKNDKFIFKENAAYAPQQANDNNEFPYKYSFWDVFDAIKLYLCDPDEIAKHAMSPTLGAFLKCLPNIKMQKFGDVYKRFNTPRKWRRFLARADAKSSANCTSICASAVELSLKFESLINRDFADAIQLSIYAQKKPINEYNINIYNKENNKNEDNENYTNWHYQDYQTIVEGIKQFVLLNVSYSDMVDVKSGFYCELIKFIVATFGLINISSFCWVFIMVMIFALTRKHYLKSTKQAIEMYNLFFEIIYVLITKFKLSEIRINDKNKCKLVCNYLVNTIHTFPAKDLSSSLHKITFGTISKYRSVIYSNASLLIPINNEPVMKPTLEKFVFTQNINTKNDPKSAAAIYYPLMQIIPKLQNKQTKKLIFAVHDDDNNNENKEDEEKNNNDDDDDDHDDVSLHQMDIQQKPLTKLKSMFLVKPTSKSNWSMVVVAEIQEGHHQQEIIDSVNENNQLLNGVLVNVQNWQQQQTINYIFSYLFKNKYKEYQRYWYQRNMQKLNEISYKDGNVLKKEFMIKLQKETNKMITALKDTKTDLQSISIKISSKDEQDISSFTIKQNLKLQTMFEKYINDINSMIKLNNN